MKRIRSRASAAGPEAAALVLPPHPAVDGQSEELKLSEAVSELLDECRMVLPGIQALFGFQMVAVFSSTFAEKLSASDQKLHIVSIILVVIAIALLMTPAALHRQVEPRRASAWFILSASRLLLAAMFPLALGLSIDVFIVTAMVCHDTALAVIAALVSLATFAGLWFVYPHLKRRRVERSVR